MCWQPQGGWGLAWDMENFPERGVGDGPRPLCQQWPRWGGCLGLVPGDTAADCPSRSRTLPWKPMCRLDGGHLAEGCQAAKFCHLAAPGTMEEEGSGQSPCLEADRCGLKPSAVLSYLCDFSESQFSHLKGGTHTQLAGGALGLREGAGCHLRSPSSCSGEPALSCILCLTSFKEGRQCSPWQLVSAQ